MIIGEYWINCYIVFIHPLKGKDIFDNLKHEFICKGVSKNECIQNNPSMMISSQTHQYRNQYMKDIEQTSFSYFKKYINPNKKSAINYTSV